MALRICLLGLALFASSCISVRPPKTNVASVADTHEDIPPGHALVVFVRPWKQAFGETFFLYKDDGSFLGEIHAQNRLHVIVPAGEHTFVGWGHMVMGDYRNPTLVTGTLEAGRAYQVLITTWELPVQLVSLPWAATKCSIIEESLAAKRIGPDPKYDPSIHAPGKVDKQIAEAKERFAKAKQKDRDKVWRFHNAGGTFEPFYVASLREPYFKLWGTEACVNRKAEMQAQIDFKSWTQTLKAAGFTWTDDPKKK